MSDWGSSWQKEALCRDTYDLRFHGSVSEQRQVRRELCIHCPVQQECRDAAVATGERLGVWGGRIGKVTHV